MSEGHVNPLPLVVFSGLGSNGGFERLSASHCNVTELQLEDTEAMEMCLDKFGVPREQQGETLSLWGRVVIYGDMRASAVAVEAGFVKGLATDLPTA